MKRNEERVKYWSIYMYRCGLVGEGRENIR